LIHIIARWPLLQLSHAIDAHYASWVIALFRAISAIIADRLLAIAIIQRFRFASQPFTLFIDIFAIFSADAYISSATA